MNLNKEELAMITKLAGLFYTPSEIARVLEIDTEEFENQIKSEESEAYKYYYKGYYQTDVSLRQSILDSAINGSSPAQTLMRDIQKLAKISE